MIVVIQCSFCNTLGAVGIQDNSRVLVRVMAVVVADNVGRVVVWIVVCLAQNAGVRVMVRGAATGVVAEAVRLVSLHVTVEVKDVVSIAVWVTTEAVVGNRVRFPAEGVVEATDRGKFGPDILAVKLDTARARDI